MTSRFVLPALIAVMVTSMLPAAASAQTQNKMLALEIKNFTSIAIPEIPSVSQISDMTDEDEVPVVTEPEVPIIIPVPEVKKTIVASKKISYQFPPRIEGDERVYMHEPEIREYLCPKMGQKNCNIFIAVLKAENGTHECTRDNRGLNRNGSLDVGLAQINWNPKYNPPYTIEQLRDCKFNLDIALKKYETRGFQPWYAYTKGAYKKFLKPAPVVAATIQ